MKCLMMVLLVTGTIATATTATAQVDRGASVLQTQPASVRSTATPVRATGTVYTQDDLNRISGSIQARPKPSSEPTILPGVAVPQSVREALKPKPIEPLEYFKVPGPERGVRIKIRETE